MNLPSLAEIEALHKKYAPHDEAFQSVYTHCQIVAEVAGQLMQKDLPGIERDVVTAGCLLHDIGVYKLYTDGVIDDANYIRHGVLGEEVLRAEGFPERLCRFCSHHTGVGLPKEQIIGRNLPLPHEDFLAENEEELLVMYADKFHSKSVPPRFNSAAFYTEYVKQFGAENQEKFKEMIDHFGLPDLESLAQKYGHKIA